MTWKENQFFRLFKNNLLWIFIVLFIATLTILSLWKWHTLGYNALDLAIYNNVFYNTLHGNFLGSSIHPPSYLGDHIEFILLALLPLYALFSHPLTLLILQTIFLGLSAWPLYKITGHYLHKPWPIVMAAAWLLHPFVLNTNLFEFHAIAFFPFFFFFTVWFFLQNKFWPYLIFFSLTLFVREDISLIMIFFSIIAYIEKRRRTWILTPALFAGLYFLSALWLNHFFSVSETYKYLSYYSWMGATWSDIILFAISHPTKILIQFIRPTTLFFVFATLLPFGFLPIFKPKYLIFTIAPFLQLALMAGGVPPAAIGMHYTILFVPSLFLAFIASIQKILLKQHTKSVLVEFLNKNKKILLPLLLLAFSYSFFTLGPALGLFLKEKTLSPENLIKEKKGLIQRVPKDASVVASANTLTNVSGRTNVQLFRYFFFGKQEYTSSEYQQKELPEYLLIDFQELFDYEVNYKTNSYYSPYYSNGSKVLKDFIASKKYGLVDMVGTLALFQKNFQSPTFLVREYKTLPSIETFINKNIEDKVILLGYDTSIKTPDTLNINLFWRSKKNMKNDYHIELTVRDKKQNTKYTLRYPFGYGAYPTSALLPGKIIQTQYFINLPDDFPKGPQDITVQLFEFDGYVGLDSLKRSFLKKTHTSFLGEEIFLESINTTL